MRDAENFQTLSEIHHPNVSVTDSFWQPRLETNRSVSLQVQKEKLMEAGRFQVWKLQWKPGDPKPPHKFGDSDVAKWLEAVAYVLEKERDKDLEEFADSLIDDLANAQQEDGYLNTYFMLVEPEKRWTNLRDNHELYCAGHLMEAAVAYWRATGKRKMLDIIQRYADHIAARFGPEPHKVDGYPGHEEIELALVRLYRVTGVQRYLDLVKFFIDQRGQQPHYFTKEAEALGEDPEKTVNNLLTYWQAHLPVREQETAEGHAVRACYLYSGMVDVAVEAGDEALLDACRRLFNNIATKRMYITGGIGSAHHGERFTFDYDLPNETAYAETCGGISLVFFAHRMLQVEPDAAYADVMERALYNNVLSGVSLDGKQFFYVNPLAVYPPMTEYALLNKGHHTFERREWFGCSCCPPNLARLFGSFESYIYSVSADDIYVHLFVNGTADIPLDKGTLTLKQDTDYPWDGQVEFTVQNDVNDEVGLNLRIPGWCGAPSLRVNGEAVDLSQCVHRGYAHVRRTWLKGDRVSLTLPMPAQKLEAHPEVRQNVGKIALQRGPLVYCLEEEDNGKGLHDFVLDNDAEIRELEWPNVLNGITALEVAGWGRDPDEWQNTLYRPVTETGKGCKMYAIPYCVWANRSPGEMRVWLNCR